MPKLLIAVKSCHEDRARGAHDLLREMWGNEVRNADLLFFTGRSGLADPDERIVTAPDDYKSLPYKTREIARYATNNGYDHTFFTDTGSFVFVHHLLRYDYQSSDYIGYWGMALKPFDYKAENRTRGCKMVRFTKCYPWASGGGYFLSRKALGIVAGGEPPVWAEDLGVGQMLAAHNIFLDDRSKIGYKGYVVDWICNENNGGNLDARRAWMQNLKDQSDACMTSGMCEAYKRPQTRFDPPPIRDKRINPTPWDRSTK